ncbi:MAG: enoyl-CoA hydratase/isomerase family protein [Calditrichaeota bacterium]|nr:enoyl-CoA hydratase/isomerase family protein [Calditrichota bacterium]
MKYLKIEKHGERFDLILNRSNKFNALNRPLLEELFSTFNELEKDKQCRLVVLRSATDKAFCSGVDLDQLLSFKSIEEARSFALMFDETMIRLLKFPKPIIAAIDGLAFGGGFALASAADLRIITENGKIAFPAGRLGAVLPPALTFMLNALVGIGISRDLLMTGRVVNADESFRLRLVNRLVNSSDIENSIDKEVHEILKSSDTALQMTRRITNQQLLVEIEKYNLTGAENFAFLASTEEWQKRVASFFNKNKK